MTLSEGSECVRVGADEYCCLFPGRAEGRREMDEGGKGRDGRWEEAMEEGEKGREGK